VPQLINYYIDHQIDVIQRRTQYRLNKAEARLHIVEGLILALDKIDQIIKVIRASKDVETARTSLMKKFKLSEIQASHILDMPLRRLTALEREKLEEEKNELKKTIKELAAILKSRKKQDDILVEELEEITNKFGDERRSRIVPDVGEVSIEDLIEDEEIIVSVSSKGYVKSVPSTSYKKQGRGGKGVKAASSDEDVIEHLLSTSEKGTVKKSAFKDFDSNYKSLQAIKLKDDDRVVSVKTTSGKEDVILVSKKGQMR